MDTWAAERKTKVHCKCHLHEETEMALYKILPRKHHLNEEKCIRGCEVSWAVLAFKKMVLEVRLPSIISDPSMLGSRFP